MEAPTLTCGRKVRHPAVNWAALCAYVGSSPTGSAIFLSALGREAFYDKDRLRVRNHRKKVICVFECYGGNEQFADLSPEKREILRTALLGEADELRSQLDEYDCCKRMKV